VSQQHEEKAMELALQISGTFFAIAAVAIMLWAIWDSDRGPDI